MDQTISVIIPIYNTEPYLRQCLDSVVNQTYRNLEIILIDDGSPDNSGTICDEYAAKDGRITVIHKKDEGVSAAWNDGLRMATGDWVTFIDSDDWVDTDYFEKMIKNAETFGLSDADILIAGGRTDEKEEPKVVRNFTQSAQFCTAEEMEYLKTRVLIRIRTKSPEKILLSALGYPWDKFFRLSFLRKHNLSYDETMWGCADMLFNFQAFDMAQKVIGCDYYGYHYRFVTNGVSKKYTPDRAKMFHDYLDKLYSYIDAHGGASPQITEAIHAAAIGCIGSSLQLYYFHPQNKGSYHKIAKEVSDMKNFPRYFEAIHAPNSQYLSFKMKTFKAILRLPWLWPLKLTFELNDKLLRK